MLPPPAAVAKVAPSAMLLPALTNGLTPPTIQPPPAPTPLVIVFVINAGQNRALITIQMPPMISTNADASSQLVE